jgi:hypothetical protein
MHNHPLVNELLSNTTGQLNPAVDEMATNKPGEPVMNQHATAAWYNGYRPVTEGPFQNPLLQNTTSPQPQYERCTFNSKNGMLLNLYAAAAGKKIKQWILRYLHLFTLSKPENRGK